MIQRDIDRAVARATGETVDYVRHMGFTLIPEPARPRLTRRTIGRPPQPIPSGDLSIAAAHRPARTAFRPKRGEA